MLGWARRANCAHGTLPLVSRNEQGPRENNGVHKINLQDTVFLPFIFNASEISVCDQVTCWHCVFASFSLYWLFLLTPQKHIFIFSGLGRKSFFAKIIWSLVSLRNIRIFKSLQTFPVQFCSPWLRWPQHNLMATIHYFLVFFFPDNYQLFVFLFPFNYGFIAFLFFPFGGCILLWGFTQCKDSFDVEHLFLFSIILCSRTLGKLGKVSTAVKWGH